MSTNYYVTVRSGTFAQCVDTLHFGKSSLGWVFSVRQYPEMGLSTLYDWVALMSNPRNTVADEYGRQVTVAEVLNVVTNRVGERRGEAVGGKTRGEGSWDYNNFEFC